ncbi:MAG: hypothetical protein IKF68_04465 [Erysipelotrichaceae bacterium]|nr:hypothetical protein [Erysipelotrichaceae bacterium]
MKKTVLCMLAVLMLLSLGACGSKETAQPENEETVQEKSEDVGNKTNEASSAVLTEMSGNYRATSLIVNGEETLTEEMAAQSENNDLLKMTVLEDGRAFLDFGTSIVKVNIDPSAMSMTVSASNGTPMPIEYENGIMKIKIKDDTVYTYEKRESAGQVIMIYDKGNGFHIEDPYLLAWGDISHDDNNILLYSQQVWLDVRRYEKDSDDEELVKEKERFAAQYGDPSTWDLNSYEYIPEEDGESYFMNYFVVGQEYYYTFRSWFYAAERSTYEPIISDIFDDHFYLEDWS